MTMPPHSSVAARTPRRRRLRFRLLAVIRVLALLCCCSLLGLWLLLRATRARAADVLVEIGQQLMQLPDAHYGRGVRQLWINGLELQLQSGSAEKPPEDVVAQFRAACSSRSSIQLNEQERKAIAPLTKEPWFADALDGVMVEEGPAGTAVVCIDPMGKPWGVLSMTEAARRFASSGDLLELGRLRYAFVRKSANGSAFLTMWTQGSAQLLEQFPRDRDAPGADFPDVARVPGSQRFLSVRLTDSLLNIYAHRTGSLEQLSGEYREALKAGGYKILERYAHDQRSLTYNLEKGPRHVILSLAETNGATLATLVSQP